MRVHTAFEGFQLPAMASLDAVGVRSKFAWYPRPLFNHDATSEKTEEVLMVEDDEGSDGPTLSAFLEALTDASSLSREWAGPVKVRLGHFVGARVSGGDDRVSAFKEAFYRCSRRR